MIKVTNLKETNKIKPLMLRAYIARKITALMEEYSVDGLDDIGCFIVLEKDEFAEFPIKEMEFVEMLEIGNKNYLHGVKIIGDSYGEDIFLTVEVNET